MLIIVFLLSNMFDTLSVMQIAMFMMLVPMALRIFINDVII